MNRIHLNTNPLNKIYTNQTQYIKYHHPIMKGAIIEIGSEI